MKEIGGYFELEVSNFEAGIHQDALKLNTARNCFEYILQVKKYSKVYIPFYTCDVLLEPLDRQKIPFEFYHINEELEPIKLPSPVKGEAVLYTNYFGIKGNFIRSLLKSRSDVIIDNSQALFEPPLPGVDSFYSLRKFIGAPDGSFLYCSGRIAGELEEASSFDRVSHLYKRKDANAESGYLSFQDNDRSLSGLPIMRISPSTKQFAAHYDFTKNKLVRERNFLYLHNQLQHLNQLNIGLVGLNGPLCYPLFYKKKTLKKLLIRQKVYVPTYWPNVPIWLNGKTCVESELVDFLLCLPTDQRYGLPEMDRIADIVKRHHE